MSEITWEIQNVLARACRPGRFAAEGPTKGVVNARIQAMQEFGIRSVICLLAADELEKYYLRRGIDLLACYRVAGIHVHHHPIPDHQSPPISQEDLAVITQTFEKLSNPVLIHCSAGIDRTGAVIDAIQESEREPES